jgi:2-methylcitrate dehydratase PrpD
VAFIHGAVGIRQFTDVCVNEPAVLALRSRVSVVEDKAVSALEGYVSVLTRKGETFASHIHRLHGSPDWPMSDAELEAKFVDQAERGTPGVDSRRLMDAIWSMDRLDDIARIMLLTVPAKR